MPALITIMLDLADQPDPAPDHLHGAACALTTTHGSGMTAPPFTVRPVIRHGNTATWQLAWLAETPPPLTPDKITFAGKPCAVIGHACRPIRYAELATTKPMRHAELRVESPMYFSRSDRDSPIPDPVLLMRGAARRWNEHAPQPLRVSDEIEAELLKRVYLADFVGGTVRTRVAATRTQTGFVGHMHLALTKAASRETTGAFAALTRFLEFAGGGAQTTHGFGSITVTDATPPLVQINFRAPFSVSVLAHALPQVNDPERDHSNGTANTR